MGPQGYGDRIYCFREAHVQTYTSQDPMKRQQFEVTGLHVRIFVNCKPSAKGAGTNGSFFGDGGTDEHFFALCLFLATTGRCVET